VSELQFLHTVAEVFVALELDVIVVADWLHLDQFSRVGMHH